MDFKNIEFEQLLTIVKQLPDEKRATLKAVLKTTPAASKKRKAKTNLTTLLLHGPVMGGQQFKSFKANREKFELWREK